MPRFEYIDHEGGAHVISAPTEFEAQIYAARRELIRTGSQTLADRAAGTVELSNERSPFRV